MQAGSLTPLLNAAAARKKVRLMTLASGRECPQSAAAKRSEKSDAFPRWQTGPFKGMAFREARAVPQFGRFSGVPRSAVANDVPAERGVKHAAITDWSGVFDRDLVTFEFQRSDVLAGLVHLHEPGCQGIWSVPPSQKHFTLRQLELGLIRSSLSFFSY